MFIDKNAKALHVVRFRNGPMVYLDTTDDRSGAAAVINSELRSGVFRNKEFQLAYEIAKAKAGLLDPNPDDVVFHQFIINANQTGYMTGHWFIRDFLARNDGLDSIANIGDWLDTEGFIDVTPSDQDRRKFIRVTDIGKYFAAQDCFSKNEYPMYILAEENSQIQSAGLIENHRDEQPKRGGYDHAMAYLGESTIAPVPLDYNHVSIDLTQEQEEIISNKPISANGRLYSNIDQFCRARNLPTWFVLEQINADPIHRYAYAQDWRFV